MSNRFENKSKSTLFIVLFISAIVLLIAFEKIVGMSMGDIENETRHIRLRENAPNINLKMNPSSAELDFSENLEDKPYAFATDANGFIQPSVVHTNADMTLAFIGGSTTGCIFVDADKRFPYHTGKLLSNSAFKVNSVNAGVSGNDSLNSINAYLNKVVPIKPDIAILMHNINDISTLLHEGSYWNTNDYRSPIVYEDKSLKAFIKMALPNTFELLYRIKTNLSGHIDEFADDRGNNKKIDADDFYQSFRANLEIFISISKAKGIQPVLMTQASRFTDKPDPIILAKFKSLEQLGIEYAQFKRLFDGMNEQTRQAAKANDILLIDLAQQIPQSKEFMVDSVHFNNQGSELVAKIISERLKAIASIKTVE